MKNQFITVFIVIALFVSCTKKTELEIALDMAGANRTELEKVLTHYSKNPADSLKLRAAEFLISNMIYHYTKENKSLSHYYNEVIKLNNDTLKALSCLLKYDSLSLKYQIENKDLKIKFDIQTIKAHYLIWNIDLAIDSWQTNTWSQQLSFSDFCEYVLPYRVGNENLEYWREKLATKYLQKIDWLKNIDNSRNSTYWVSKELNDLLIKKDINIYIYSKPAQINYPPSALENIKLGACDDYTQSTLFIMRACGIPVCIDFTPQWPNGRLGHTWNVLLEETGKEIPFMGFESSPKFSNQPGGIMAKVFRKTYSYQYESLFHIKSEEAIPVFFDNPHIKDVTNNYFSTVDVTVELFDKTKKTFAYLAVFDNDKWVPVQWGKVKDGKKAQFKAMGINCMYLPMLYDDGVCTPAGKPFYIGHKKNVKEMNFKLQNKQTMVLPRKYPINRTIYILSRNIIETVIEASNDVSFKNSAVIGKILRDPKFKWDTLNCNTEKKYRYWRLIENKKSSCDIAEFQFINKTKINIDTTNILSSLSKKKYNPNKPIYLFDDDNVTFIELKQNTGEWIGIDFGKPIAVDYFRFLPRNDDNAIVAGDSYELMMWDKTGWKSLINCIANSDKLIFKNVPSGGLYLLHNHTKGKEERIFTYENGKQVWW